jgi:hypothetical protein
MATPIYPNGLDWLGSSYAAVDVRETGLRPSDQEFGLWTTWLNTFDRARRGDFAGVPGLVEVHRESGNWILRSMCADLLGDAGTPNSFAAVRADLPTADNIITTIDHCDALAWWGKLSALPLVLQTYLSIRHFNDADIIPVRLSDALEANPGPIADPMQFKTPDAYADHVTKRCDELREQFGGDEVVLFKGQPFSVTSLARITLASITDHTFDYPLRRKFEASTGIDCSSFYLDKQFQPLSAAAILEEFLESPAAEEYEAGVRYFFGHRIPA